jgi:hypothetical protein
VRGVPEAGGQYLEARDLDPRWLVSPLFPAEAGKAGDGGVDAGEGVGKARI